MGSAVSCSTSPKSQVVDSNTPKPSEGPKSDKFQLVEMENKGNNSRSAASPDKTVGDHKQDMKKAPDKDADELAKDKGTEKKVTPETPVAKKENAEEKPMTKEELKAFKDNTYSTLRKEATGIMSMKSFRNANGEYDDKIYNVIVQFYRAYYKVQRMTLDGIAKYRLEIAQIMMETKFLDVICELVINTYKDRGWLSENGKEGSAKKLNALNFGMSTLLNFSDASEDLAKAIATKPGVIEFTKQILLEHKERHLDNVEPKLKEAEEKVVKSSLSIVHNMSMYQSNVTRLRDCGMIDVLKPYLQSANEMYSLNVLASLSGIINEEESDIINSNKDIVLFLLDILRQAMQNNLRRCRGWSARETGFTVRLLTRNDANKKLLVDLGALELLVELGRTGNFEEKDESVQAIWALAFDDDNAALITSKAELGVVDLLVDLKQTEGDAIRKSCNGALWTLRDALKKSKVAKYKEIGDNLSAQTLVRKKSAVGRKTGHIMISYQWADQVVLKNVKERIRAHGYMVWMDIDQMGGSTLQAMAEAVEGADVFLMCMSNKYKNSPSCRAEAEYAYQLRKKIIPLKMERGYTPDGWLGFVLGAKLFFEFSEKYPFEQKMPALLKEIDNLLMKKGGDEAGGHQAEVEVKQEKSVKTYAAIKQVSDQPDSASANDNPTVSRISVSMATLSKIRTWSKNDVTDWIEKKGLKGCGLDNITGDEIALLANMRVECPEFFYKCLQDMLKVKNLLMLAKLYWALQELS